MTPDSFYPVWTYLVYLTVSVALTMWVARTLHRNGRIFLVDAFHGNEGLADSVNHLLVVGFYLVNIGFVMRPEGEGEAIRHADVDRAAEQQDRPRAHRPWGDALHEHDHLLQAAPPRDA